MNSEPKIKVKQALLLPIIAVSVFAATEGYSYSDRLHIRVFDKKKGV